MGPADEDGRFPVPRRRAAPLRLVALGREAADDGPRRRLHVDVEQPRRAQTRPGGRHLPARLALSPYPTLPPGPLFLSFLLFYHCELVEASARFRHYRSAISTHGDQ